MFYAPAVPLLLFVLVGLLLGLVARSFLRAQSQEVSEKMMDTHSNLLLWLSVLAVIILGAFLIYLPLIMLIPEGR